MNDQAVPEQDEAFEAILEYLKEARGFDFTGYKRSSLGRRVDRRMAQVGFTSYGEYLDFLQVTADEFVALFNTILINVTSFFRDADAWDYLQSEIVPMILAERGPEDGVRIWSAGCASGEEAYTLAIVLAEALGIEQFRQRVKIYATDVDEEALAQARAASYPAPDVEALPREYVDKYFERQGGGRYVFHKELRRSVIFGRNDLVQDAPISRIDLLVCRNALMYFNADTQASILRKLHFALTPRGVLFMGRAEMLLSHGRIFDPVDLRFRVFRKVSTGPAGSMFGRALGPGQPTTVGEVEELRALAFGATPVAQLVVNNEDLLALANQQAQQVFGLTERDIGRPLRDLEISYRPVELRRFIDQARHERRAVRVKDVEWQRGPGEALALELHVSPLVSGDEPLGISIVFHDVTASHRLLSELSSANTQRENAYEELQSTTEELETTNEELQSTVEELETTNEELQSTNEELETTNEELQSTNDELQTINNALRERTGELDDVNDFLEAILTSLRTGVVVIDQQMRVIAWNAGAEELWGVRRDEAMGEHLLNLDIGLPVAELRPAVRPALADPGYIKDITLEAVNRRGRAVTVRVSCGALRNSQGESTGAIMVMEVMAPATQDIS
ncbi:CheR family methyltransferase [Amycolatopsis sp.]|uniref:CheR family methyltransferase n=1 Tax=Amycolatopsis sp. TaxID=37632 RepID=UPI002B714E67|nr:CheR family methyltransferase [Amycolatopsis sp.]HVV09891.1 CheR family methyltransferase [Amycolatopsis sp.]